MRKLRALVALLVIFLTLRWWACQPAKDPRPEHRVANRVWVDKIAKGPRDPVLRLILAERGRMRTGVVAVTTKYRASAERLAWQLQKRTLRLTFPQERQKVSFEVRTFACEGPGSLDLCLELTAGRRTLRLYGRKGARVAEAAPWGLEALAPVPAEAPLTEARPGWFEARASRDRPSD